MAISSFTDSRLHGAKDAEEEAKNYDKPLIGGSMRRDIEESVGYLQESNEKAVNDLKMAKVLLEDALFLIPRQSKIATRINEFLKKA